MKMILVCLLFINTAMASYPELFGASFSTSGIGNQANFNVNDPSNNYYAPALLGLTDNFNVLLQSTSTATHFKSINNITVTNSTNSNNPSTVGNAKVSYPKFYGSSLHASIPVGGVKHMGSIGLSIFAPIGTLVETNTGDPFLPEYVMYKSRYQRTSSYLNFAKKWDDNLAWSLGVLIGFQATAEVRSNFSLNGANQGSWAKSQTKVDPSLGAIVSVAKTFDHSAFYFTYQQEMKSNFKASAYGEITNPSIALIDSQLASMMFYDPHTFRLGSTIKSDSIELFGGVEYQMWTGYKTPIMTVGKNGGVVVPSSAYEKIHLRDTINPRIGTKINLTDRWSTLLGLAYRMTPFKGDFSGSGNSVDTNSYIGTAGLQYRMVIWSKDVHLGSSLQYHRLEDKKVTKSSGQENGAAGDKIGAPGYNLGGYILAASLGVKFNF
jgi:long-subunit fatty acid transport protein